MNILFICHRFPFPPNRGGKIRPFNMIRHLSRQHSVAVASLAHTEREFQEGVGLREYCADIIADVLPTAVRWRQACTALFSPRPSSLAYFRSSRLVCRLQQVWSERKFDFVFVHCAFAAQYATGLKGARRILDFGDLDSGKYFDYSRQRAFPLSLGYGLEARKLRRYEREVAWQFDRCTVTTPGELEVYRALDVSVPCSVIPNGVDLNYFRKRTKVPEQSHHVVFLGRMDYFPNVDGVSYFAREVFPLVRRRVPDAELQIVGSSPIRPVLELARMPGVSVTGYVPDVRPYLDEAAVAVAPLRLARGTQNKILECMAVGVPVVSTPEAAKGIQASPGRDLFVAGTAEAFAQQVSEVLLNAELQNRLGEAGRRQVETAHTWALSMNLLDNLLDECAGK